MYINQNFINGINANSPQSKVRLTIDGVVFNSDEHISNASFEFASKSFIGEFPSWKVTATMQYEVKPDYRNKDVFVEVGSVHSGVTTYIPFGYFKIDVDGQETDDITREITLTMFDAAYFKFKSVYTPTVTFPCNGLDIIQDICNQAGVTLELPFNLTLDYFTFNEALNMPEDATLREVVAHYAYANLSIAYINRSGHLTFKCVFYKNSPALEMASTHDFLYQFTHDELAEYTHDEIVELAIDKTVFTFDDYSYDQLKAENHYGPINSVSLSRSTDGDDIVYDDVVLDDEASITENGLYRIRVNNNYFTDNIRELIIQSLFDLAKGFTYIPYDVNVFARPDLDPGDLFILKDINNVEYHIPIVNVLHEFNGGMMSSISLSVIDQAKEKYEPAGIATTLRRVAIKADKANGKVILLAEEVDSLDGRVQATEVLLEPEQFAISVGSAITDKYGNTIENVQKNFKFNADGMSISSSENSFEMRIDEEELGFYDNGVKTAHINNAEFNIKKGRVEQHLIVGVHKIEKYNSSITVIRFIGE